jgi:hypothetical protein
MARCASPPSLVKVRGIFLPTIPLDRRFLGWSKELENTDPDAILPFGRSTDLSNRAEISERRRLVILAEAGAGKTAEMREQARWRIEAGQFAFFATVEDVAADGLEVVVDDGLFDPGEAEIIDRVASFQRLAEVKSLVEIDHQARLRPDCLSDGFYRREVIGEPLAAKTQL